MSKKPTYEELKRRVNELEDVEANLIETQKQLQNSENRLPSFLNNSPVGIAIWDREFRYVYINEILQKINGPSLKEHLGKTIEEVLPKAAPIIRPVFEKILSTREPALNIELSGEMPATPDQTSHYLLSYFPIFGESQTIEHIGGIIVDITDKKNAQIRLNQQQNIFQTIIDNVPALITVYEPKAKVLHVNKAFESTVGWTNEDLKTIDIMEVCYPDSEYRAKAADYMQKASNEWREFSIKTKDGHSFDSLWSNVRLKDSTQIGIGIDITERKKAEVDLAYSNVRYKALFNDSPVPLWEEDFTEIYEYFSKLKTNGITDFRAYFDENSSELAICAQKVKIIDVNQATLALCEAENREDLFGNLDKIFTEKSLTIFKEEIITLAEGKFEFESEGEVKTLTGEPRYVFIKLIIDQKQKKLGRALISTTDLTDRKKVEKKLRQSQKMESIGKLAGGIAHDFNNILYPIIGFSQLSIEDLPKRHPVQENLQDILNGAKRARDLIKQILLFSRQTDLRLLPISLRPVIEEALKLLRSSLPANVEIQTQFYEGEDCVLCDTTEIHEIVMNLCTNAFHSVEGANGIIKVSLDRREPPSNLELPPKKYLCLTVSDNGMGIPENELEKIFEPYYTTKEVGKGSGLGLSVVHGIVQNYKGDIHVENNPESGAIFSIFLPVSKKSVEIEDEHQGDNPSAGTEKILFVDDEKNIVKLGIRSLERLGYKVTGIQDSLQAFLLFESNPQKYDLIITDMAMPGMVGTQMAEKMLNIRSDIPIIICSGYSERISSDKAKALKIKAFIDKPILIEELATKVREVLDNQMTE